MNAEAITKTIMDDIRPKLCLGDIAAVEYAISRAVGSIISGLSPAGLDSAQMFGDDSTYGRVVSSNRVEATPRPEAGKTYTHRRMARQDLWLIVESDSDDLIAKAYSLEHADSIVTALNTPVVVAILREYLPTLQELRYVKPAEPPKNVASVDDQSGDSSVAEPPKWHPHFEGTCTNPAECCRELSRVWMVLGIDHYNGKSASENVSDLRRTRPRL